MEFRKVYNESPSDYIKSVGPVYSYVGFGEVKRRNKENEKEKEHFTPRKRVKDYFSTLAKATETSNQQLEERGIPFRFCLYKEGERVLIDFVTLDETGKKKASQRTDITNEDFNLWIENIANIAGLNFDQTG